MTADSRKKVLVLMPSEMHQQIKELSQRTGRTVPAYIRQVLKLYLQYKENGMDLLE